jgi:hypothetical protein
MSETLRLAIEVDASKGTAVVKEFTGTVDQAKAEWSKVPAAAQGPLAQFNTQMQALQSQWSGVVVGAGIVAGGIYVATRAIGAFADAAAEAEQIESRMAFQLGQAGYNFSAIKPIVDDFANSVQRTTRFTDEMARQGLGQMMQYIPDVNKAMEAVRLAMDMSTQTGMDFISTTRYMGMAMTGDVEILGRYIPALRDLDAKLGANATSAEKAAYAIEVLNKTFSGAAAADLETYAGKVQHLKNQWDDFKEAVGKEIVVPALQNWLDWINLGIEGAEGLGSAYDKIRASWQSLMTGESRASILTRERVEAYRALLKVQLEADEKAAQLLSIKREIEEFQKRKALRAEQEKMDADYQAKYLLLSGDRIAAIQRERDQILQVAWQKGLSLYSIETYYNSLIVEEQRKKADEIRGYNLQIRDDAINIMRDWGIKTEAAAQSEVTGVLAQFQKIVDSGLFNKDQLEAAKTRVIEKLREIQQAYTEATGHWEEISVPVGKELAPSGMEYRTVWESEWRWVQEGTSKVTQNVDAMIEGAIANLDNLAKATAHPYAVLINTDSITEAERRIAAFEDRLREIVSRQWVAHVYVTGIGSSEKPIMEKIDEIYGGFENMQAYIADMKATVEMESINAEIAALRDKIGRVINMPHMIGFGEKYYQSFIPYYQGQINALEEEKRLLAGAQAAYAAPAPAAAQAVGGGGGPTIEININSLQVIGGSDFEIAQKLDGAIADLIYSDRSKIKAALS